MYLKIYSLFVRYQKICYNIHMRLQKNYRGFTVLETMVAMAIFLLFAVGVYSGINMVFKIVYQSRLRLIETSLLAEKLEVVRNLPYDSVGIISGVPAGVLPRTQTEKRNGIDFVLTTTVRNSDDPFDGTAASSTYPDLSAADYKTVEIEVICNNCGQKESMVMSTIVAPKQLEGASQNGHLFVSVSGADGRGISGANVHVSNTSINPNISIDEVTDNDGWFRLVDTPTGTQSYNITVSKSGYSSDYTVVPSVSNPSPKKLPSNVAAQMVTEVYFMIDQLGSINLRTIDSECNALGGKTLKIWNNKLIGSDPDVYKFYQTVVTDGNGNYSFPSLEFGNYFISATSTAYDIGGSTPLLPLTLAPGDSQEVSIILVPHTANSLLVKVLDAGTKLSLSDATVRLYNGSGYDQTILTGVGYVRQTDWSGGSGQVDFIDETKYFSDDGGLSVSGSVGDIKLKKTGNNYSSSGYLESSTFDFGEDVDWHNVIFEPTTQPLQTGNTPIRLQIATSNSSTPAAWDFSGPDGTVDTYYSPADTMISDVNNGKRYMRYRLYLSTENTRYTPQVSELSFTYTNSCTPPGQAFFSDLSAGTYSFDITRIGYTPSTDQIEVNGTSEAIVDMSTQ